LTHCTSLLQGAEILSEVLGHKVTHKSLPPDEYKATLLNVGLPPPLVDLIILINGKITNGEDGNNYDSEKAIKGKRYIKDWFEENKAVYQP
jgi:festuclavine dehydrogenase